MTVVSQLPAVDGLLFGLFKSLVGGPGGASLQTHKNRSEFALLDAKNFEGSIRSGRRQKSVSKYNSSRSIVCRHCSSGKRYLSSIKPIIRASSSTIRNIGTIPCKFPIVEIFGKSHLRHVNSCLHLFSLQ